MDRIESIANTMNYFVFAKSKTGKFLFANEAFAQIAGADSVQALIGKTDKQTVWATQADYFSTCDQDIIAGKNFFSFPETIALETGQTSIVTTKQALLNLKGKPIGVAGFFFIAENTQQIAQPYLDKGKQCFHLGGDFYNAYLTTRETEIYRAILHGDTTKLLAKRLKLSVRTVEYYLNNIKAKLNCSTITALLSTAIKHHHYQYLI